MKEIKDEKERRIAETCGKKIKGLREREGYSQEELAELLGCSTETVGRVERGKQTLKYWRLNKACEVFHVSRDYLLSDRDASDLSAVPSYLVELFQGADQSEYALLSEQMLTAAHMIEYVRYIKDNAREQLLPENEEENF